MKTHLTATGLLIAMFVVMWLKCAGSVAASAGICLKAAALLLLPEAAKIALAAILAINLVLLVARIPSRDTPH